jgi:predicted TIM-barrel fold metal-dependent hydrolase
MTFEEYEPTSTLVVTEHLLYSAKYSFIDIHSHQPYMADQDLTELIESMDSLNMRIMVNLSGRWGKQLKRMVDNIERNGLSNRFIVFTNIDFSGFGMDGWTEAWVEQIKMDHTNGAKGLKIFKELGMTHKDETGKRIRINDPRLDAIWEVCGELGMPVLIHSGAPPAFWEAMDQKNERWLEMYLHKDRRYSNSNPAPWEQIIAEQHDMFSKHPNTIFINAHFGWFGNDLRKLSQILDELPNMYIEFGAVIAELGRQPRSAQKFFEKYQDRILFGKDSWVPSEYMTYFRILETQDEYFPYHKKYHAFWPMYGIGLTDQILKKIYYKNALKLIPSMDRTLFPD